MSRAMAPDLSVQTCQPEDLSVPARDLWSRFRAADPAFRSPYFDFRYVLAAGEAAPESQVAVIRRRGEIVGFLPFQRRGRLIQPIAAPLTDYHGLLSAPGAEVDLAAVVGLLGARRFRFSGLVGDGGGSRLSSRPAMVADLSDGFEAYTARRPAEFFKDKRRRGRRLAETLGPLDFTFDADGEGVLDLIFRLKRAQMRRTGQHDIFASPWTMPFLRRLSTLASDDFGLRFATLRAGSRIVAAEVGLRSGSAYHLWFPVYDPEFARYSPGALMTLETLRAAPDQGIATVDFGPAGEDYKRDFAEPGQSVFEGDVTAGGWVETARAAANLALAHAPDLRESISRAGRRLDRRWDRITACEPRFDGRAIAASQTLGDLGRRHPRASIGLGLGLGLGLMGLVAD
ncbi:MAG: GNAT family N-acetyltransferase [Phenylobacterium sp.]|nr:GNAT family N-acetyltransferase [Phenylobacterium sp.]HQT55282.1 GNAT family N-acetyltransferase [Phenylobacterium sp.]